VGIKEKNYRKINESESSSWRKSIKLINLQQELIRKENYHIPYIRCETGDLTHTKEKDPANTKGY
jgi:hypothetical protein